MKNNIFTDISTAVGIFTDARKARKQGREVTVKRIMEIPVIKLGPAFLNTPEGCMLANHDRKVFDIAFNAFHQLPAEEAHQFEFLPKGGEFVERAGIWKTTLKPVMTDRQFHFAIGLILDQYINLKRRRISKAVVDSIA